MVTWKKALLIGFAIFTFGSVIETSAAVMQDFTTTSFGLRSFCNCLQFNWVGTKVKCRVKKRKLVETRLFCEYSSRCAPWPFGPPGLETRKEYVYLIEYECREYICFACVEAGPFGMCMWCPLPTGDPMYKEKINYRVVRLGCGCYSTKPLPVKRVKGEEK